MDALIVQSPDAGGHWGTFTPARPPERLRLPDLVRAVRSATDLPIMAVGGIGASADVAAALEAGAEAVAVGTLLLLATEAGTNPAHRAGFDRDRGDPVTTSAFSGRPASGLPNAFLAAYDGRGPLGYPALHHLTSPIRRAAAAAGQPRAREPLGRRRPPQRRGTTGRRDPPRGLRSLGQPSSGSCRGRRSDRRAAPSGGRW